MDNYYDVVVVGGGTSGVVSAIAAAKKGAKTLLVERYGFLGGSANYGFPFLAFFSGNGEKVVGGIAEDIVQRLIKEQGSKGHMRGGKWKTEENYEFSLTPYEPEIYKYIAQEMAGENNVNLALHSYLLGTIVSCNRIVGIEILTKSGRKTIYGNTFIDASGDADLSNLAGAPFEYSAVDSMQNVTLTFVLDNVNLEKMFEDLQNDGNIKGRDDWHVRLVRGEKIGTDKKDGIVHMAGHMSLWDDKTPMSFTAVSWRDDMVSLNLTRTVNIDPVDGKSIVDGEISERRNVVNTFKQCQKRIPGMEKCYLIKTAHQVGVRESRRVIGEYCITEEDVVNCRRFEDGIARGAYPIDIHDPKGGKTQFTFLKNGGSYSIPYRCMIPKNIDNLIVTGRIISATHAALGSTRLQATCMALGEAAGVAAAFSVKNKVVPRNINVDELKRTLIADKAII